jgi:MerR family transcriptional regulator, light-induced transcriptional regulator
MHMANYSIKDLEKLSGIKAHTLRIWEKRYNLVAPKRTSTNIRYYDNDDLKRILNIALLNRNGTKISQIATLDVIEICSRINDLSKNIYDTASQIDNLVISMIELDEKKFNKILSASIMQFGFEGTVLNTIYPFFEKIGLLWQTGAVNPAQEHFISNLIRQKLNIAIDGLLSEDKPDAKSFLLFLPEGELHEIGLMFYHFLLKKYGHKVLYLGQSVPFEDLDSVFKIRPVDCMITSFSSNINRIDINHYLLKLSKTFKDKQIYFSTFNYGGMISRFPKNLTRVQNATQFVDILKSF